MNKAIMKYARSMRLHGVMPLHLWEKAINIVIYLINRGTSTPLGSGILEEAWVGKNVSYSFPKTFSCEAFIHIDMRIKPS